MRPRLRQRLGQLHRRQGFSYQARGRRFERWLHDLLGAVGLDPRTNYRPRGEEIDGSFVLDGHVLLLEAKWHRDPLPASSIYAFKAKVDGKLVGTVGVYISMSGYSEDAIEALRVGKTINVILFDQHDIEAAVDAFEDVLRFKLRQAAQQGEVYVPFTAASCPALAAPKPTDVDRWARQTVSDLRQAEPGTVVFVVEGSIDRAIVSVLADLVLQHAQSNRKFLVFVAHGRLVLQP
jgi:Restriction endonuclease